MPRTPKKTADLPPKGPANRDPITNAPGAHPIEAGAGAALGGAAAGLAAGAVAGPVGAVVGAVAGGIAGGYGGKALGEMIDPTTDDSWLEENFETRPYVGEEESFEEYKPVYRFGGEAERRYGNRSFTDIENNIQSDYARSPIAKQMDWNHARPAVQDAYDRTCQLRKERGEAVRKSTKSQIPS